MKCFLICGSKKEPISINGTPNVVKSKYFEGDVKVRLRDYETPDEEYFEQSNDTCSIMIRGRFLPTESTLTADDILFGNQFEKPLRDVLPMGSNLLMKGLQYVDPSIEFDLYCDQPWAFSPFFATMTKMQVSDALLPMEYFEDHSSRRSQMQQQVIRQESSIDPNKYILADFCNPFFNPSTLSISIPYTKMSFSIKNYYNGQPLRYFCKTRDGNVIFAVEFDL
ncbi:Elongation factor G, mitochondrial [Schizosaccharomyces pombe]|uniref:DUF1769 family protein n=1 Tax=Schizosaccharomyces pombe (strain 972 / ATCC 24843) TaxID=284812 RepID=DUC2_SCHPO|nr:uncharacterized protein SPBC409.17c [Schizosaccharomyces pombe]Q9UUA7.1 RecName: Full=UPF0590 protein C409.17c [Schizosaccharomyces pombe 972h-]CAB52619.1 DUF1769 family protein [Schizosaccharomyces pombe]|eukprot:NP_595467.1 uncharacterized protein SPBC409.17c [Schizosaccharomyces pombe]